MKPKNLKFSIFILVSVAQVLVLIQMIANQPDLETTGTPYKFKIDPRVRADQDNTAYSGDFIWLRFEISRMKLVNNKDWKHNRSLYLVLSKDSLGYAKVESVSKTKPSTTSDWIRAAWWVNWKDSTEINLNLPFNQYYIKNGDRKDVESLIKTGLKDSLKTSYLNVKIRENQFLSGDLMIGDVSFKDMLKKIKH